MSLMDPLELEIGDTRPPLEFSYSVVSKNRINLLMHSNIRAQCIS